MSENRIDGLELAGAGGEFGAGGDVSVGVRFSVRGSLRDAFGEESWTAAYDRHDNTFKLKYGIRLQAGGLKRRTLGEVDSYRKASIFWTRNPRLVNPMRDRRVWVQVAKNFRPVIRLTEEEVRQELFDFDEAVTFRASELGPGTHRVSAEASASWQRHDYAGAGSARARSAEAEITIR